MMTKQQAREAVAAKLQDRWNRPDDTFVVIDTLILELPFGWIFFYNSKKFVETKRLSLAVSGNGPVFVNKHSGVVEFCDHSKTLREFIPEFESNWTI